MNIEISPADLDQKHRIGNAGQNKPRPIIVKLSKYDVRKKVFSKSERIQCKYNGKLNIKVHGNSKEIKDRTRVPKCVDI